MHDGILIAHIADMSETKKEKDMDRYVCITCGWVYDPAEGDLESGIAPGTPFKGLPEEWVCPTCGVGKEYFEKER
jgi:rubredoxin